MQKVKFIDLGTADYKPTWDFQHEIVEQISAVKMRNRNREKTTNELEIPAHHLLFVEHPPVFTLGRSGSLDNLKLSENELFDRKIEFFSINRGGDITFHGPGQLVGYPILDLEFFFSDVHKYVRLIEEIFIRVCADFGLAAGRIEGLTGVWLDGRGSAKKRKICAIGVHLTRWITLHGWAFNVNNDLDFFNHIIPCGIADEDKTVTSLANELGEKVDMQVVKRLALQHFSELFECEII